MYFVGLYFLAISPLQAQYSEQDLLREANSLFDEGEYGDAMPKYAQLLSLNPTSPELNYKFGATSLYGDASKKADASKYLKFAVDKPGTDPLAWYFLGRAYHLNYQFADAVTAYEQYRSLVSSRDAAERQVDLKIESCRNGTNLLSNIKEVVVLDKKQSQADFFFRLYDLSDIGGKILVTPDELLSSTDKKRGHKSLIHFRGIGTTVYFSSYGKDDKNGLDIYQAEVLPNGEFSDPVPVSGGVNTPFDENYPFLHPDNKTFYFSSTGHNSMGGYDVFKSSFAMNSGAFSTPENLDFAVNTPDDDIFYIADSLNRLANFASARSSRQGEMHVYKVEVTSLPLELTLLKGNFANRIDALNKAAKITVINAATNKEVDVQYTDPANGDYVLSFPKSGKYKFLVEAKNSDMIHSGLVDIPTSDGISAFVQEMELVTSAGVEKLLINNLFDQEFDGDIASLMQDLLRRKAALEINFNDVERPEVVEEVLEPNLFANAYNDAGFGAGLSNEKVLEDAERRVSEYSNAKTETGNLIAGAVALSAASEAIAKEELSKAEGKIQEANDLTGDAADQAMFEAAAAQFKASAALREAENARALERKLSDIEKEQTKKFNAARSQVDSLESAINSSDYDVALIALKREADVRAGLDKVEDRFDPLGDVQASSTEVKNNAKRKMDNALSMREEAEVLQGQWLTKKRQREKLSGKQAEKLDQEIAMLSADISDLRTAAARAFDEAEAYQAEAADEQAQYEMLASLLNQGAAQQSADANTQGSTAASRKALADQAQGLAINEERVARYIETNPQLAGTFGSDVEELAFKKQFSSTAGLELASADSPNSNSESEESKTDQSAETKEGQPSGDDQQAKSGQENAVETLADASPKPIDPAPTQNGGANSLAQVAQSGVKGAGTVAPTAFVPVIADAGEKQETDAATTQDQAVAQEVLPEPGTLQAEKRIQAEQVRVQAAQDWIGIIDDSIEELQAGVGGDETNEEDVQDQLAQYRQLRAEKLGEVEKSNALIESLSGAANVSAMQKAESDLDTLDAALVARLESKISEVNMQGGYVANIKSIDREYLSEMASIEMSGQSAPEIAAQRIALNESFIAQLDKVVSREAFAEITPDQALELRRIKTLEVQMDREVEAGTSAYAPRTVQAIEYDELLAGDQGKRAEPVVSPLADLDPEIQKSLANSYARESIYPGYEAAMAKAADNSNSSESLALKVETNEAFLAEIEQEIAIFEEAVNAENGAIPAELNDRYQLLLIDKANAQAQINTDKTELDVALAQNSAPTSTPKSKPAKVVIPTTDYQALSAQRIAAVEALNLNNQDDLRAKADANRELNKEINREIESLMPLLDASTDDATRDKIQIRIQQLDALAADKLQEADRLETEADIDAAAIGNELMAEETPENNAAVDDSEASKAVIAPDDLKFSIDENPDYQLMEYKSLNANIQYSELQASIDSANTYRARAREILADYNASTDSDERKMLYDEFAEVSTKVAAMDRTVNEEIAKSNRSEIDFYSEASIGLIARLEDADISTEERAQLKAESDAIIETKRKLEQNQDLINTLDPSETASRAALLKEDRALISELGDSYSRISDIDAKVNQPEAEPELVVDPSQPLAEVPTALTEGAEIAASTADAPQKTALPDVNQNLPIPGRTYVTPASQARMQTMTPAAIATLSQGNTELSQNVVIPAGNDNKTWEPLITAMTPIDAQGVAILEESPEKFDLLTAVLAADTLQALEKAKGAYALRISESAAGQLAEAARVREMVKFQSNEGDKDFLIQKAMRLESQAEVSYRQAAIAASQAEELRAQRIVQEQRIATAMKQLDQKDLAELNAIVELPAYSVVAVDLTSTKPGATASANTRTGRKPEPQSADVPAPVSDNVGGTPSVSKPAVESAAEPLATAKTTAPASAPSSPNLEKGSANWLAMVEIVAEKTDFSDVKETMFVSADKPVYGEGNPIPINPEMPSGLIFQVQVGAFRNPIPQELFGEFAPIMGQRLPNGITRYSAGIFEMYKEAVVARNAIRGKGYSDAFVVAYLNGEKLTGSQAEQILAQARLTEDFSLSDEQAMTSTGKSPVTADTSSPSDALTSTPTEKTAYYNDPEAAAATQVEVVSGLFFTVQVGVYSKPVKLADLYNLSNLNSELTSGGMIRYTTGRFASVSEALSGKQAAIDAGVTDAFITAYNDGARIGLQDAAAILSSKGAAALSVEVAGDAPAVAKVYVVLIGQFDGDVPQELANVFLERSELGIRRMGSGSGTATYVSPEFPTVEAARAHLAKCVNAGIDQAAVMQLEGDKLLSLETK